MLAVTQTADILGLFGEPTRIRLLSLLAVHELTVSELTTVTQLGQSRVSTHLAKLKEAGLLRDRSVGTSTFYRLRAEGMPDAHRKLWDLLRADLKDEVLESDLERAESLIRGRQGGARWPDLIAGEMDRHYSPGRTWEATARAFVGLMRLGQVLDVGCGDGAIAGLLAPRAQSLTCLDHSARLLSAARHRLRGHDNVCFATGDMHALPFAPCSFDQVLLLNVLNLVTDPARVVAEAARVLQPGGQLVVVTLDAHDHPELTARYQHLTPGFEPFALRAMLIEAGLVVQLCDVISRERRKPYFQVVAAFADRPLIH